MDKSGVYSSMMNSRKLNSVNSAALVKNAGMQDRSGVGTRIGGEAGTATPDRRKSADRRRISHLTA